MVVELVLDVAEFLNWTQFLAELVNVPQKLIPSFLFQSPALHIPGGLITCMCI